MFLSSVLPFERRWVGERFRAAHPRHRRPHRPREDDADPGAHGSRYRPPARRSASGAFRSSSVTPASELPSGQSLSVIDVPGHERFVRTMVAGATGIDLYLMAIAADDGVMPQTREHAADPEGAERPAVGWWR